MSICKIKLISIIGLMSDLDEVLKICGDSGIFQPDDVFKFYSNINKFKRITTEENPYTKHLKTLVNIFKTSDESLERVNIEDFHLSKKKIDEYIKNFCFKLDRLFNKKKKIEEKLSTSIKELNKLANFFGLNVRIEEILSCKSIKIRFGKISLENYNKLNIISEDDLFFYTCKKNNVDCWGIFFENMDEFEKTDKILSNLNFEEIKICYANKGTIEENTAKLEIICKNLQEEIKKINYKIKEFWRYQRSTCLKLYCKLEKLSIYYEMRKYAVHYRDNFIMTGWVSVEKHDEIFEKLDNVTSIDYSSETGDQLLKYSPPIKLKNFRIFKPFEFLIEMYGFPSYNEIDPTIFFALTYIIMFGVMFADLGQGLLVSAAGYLMWKMKKMKLGKILIPCGISSCIFGLIFGSVFGYERALDSFYKKVFNLEEKPIEIMASSNVIIYTAISLGIFLLIVAMILNVISLFEQNKKGEAIFSSNGICGIVLYIAAIFYFLDKFIFKFMVANNILYATIFIVVPVLLILLSEIFIKLLNKESNWRPTNWGDYITQSIFEFLEIVLSYVTNTMSFMRVGAFVLVHSGLMMAVFIIAESYGPVGYLITIIIGNIFVVVLETLLTGMQVLRLEFYELFSKYFKGSGRVFKPVESNLN
ncbi:MAG: V-type ATP synthase subunit I [Candidatus Paraimprobicoccus trichonymphae]|uniref:V-type ATP synthase subunit I n=1 Tax=Candidatus Paraimprobicoccus trichonymphae TaxID=3033793 RepID=A0AA48KZU1_9FIRM|nr:MAG: V-type ATP synthase subunit I [Candidatus Paraimprobicoccus trichonymphae]